MDRSKFTLAGVIGGIVYFFLGWLVYGIVLRDVTALPDDIRAVVEYPPEEFKMSFMIISCLVYGLFLSFIASYWAKVSTLGGGFKVGAIVGVFVTLAVGFGMSSMFRMNTIPQIFINAVAEIVCAGGAGAVIGWFLGRGK